MNLNLRIDKLFVVDSDCEIISHKSELDSEGVLQIERNDHNRAEVGIFFEKVWFGDLTFQEFGPRGKRLWDGKPPLIILRAIPIPRK
jgi:hypothetical protein